MKSTLITGAAIVAALVVVLFDRIVFPSLVFAFRVVEASFAPDTDVLLAPVVEATAVTITEELTPAPTPRKARRRKPSAKTLTAIEAIA